MLMRNKTRLAILEFLVENRCDSVRVVDDGLTYRVDFTDGKIAFLDRSNGDVTKMILSDRKTEVSLDKTLGFKAVIHEVSSRLRNLDTTMKRSLGLYERKR